MNDLRNFKYFISYIIIHLKENTFLFGIKNKFIQNACNNFISLSIMILNYI